jgi:hypothetical protein
VSAGTGFGHWPEIQPIGTSDRAAISEHLEPDHLDYTGGILSVTHGWAADPV